MNKVFRSSSTSSPLFENSKRTERSSILEVKQLISDSHCFLGWRARIWVSAADVLFQKSGAKVFSSSF